MAATLPPRPADPSLISFARECFEEDGETITYAVGRSALHSGPAVFTDRDQAEAFARRSGRPVEERRSPKLRRVRWS